MTRVPSDTDPQRRLADLLRVEIDESMARNRPTRRLERLVAANPRSIWSTHVTHNIGIKRASWLALYAEGPRGA